MTERIPGPVTREQLHELVWSEPLRTLAPRLGYSDVGLAKACRKMKVPLPGRGYWAKKAAGKGKRKASLRPLPNGDRTTPRELTPRQPTPGASGADPPALSPPVAHQVEFEAKKQNKIRVPKTLRSPQALVRTTRDVLSGSARSPEDFEYNWQVPHLDVDVSKALMGRALRIMNAVVKAFEKRGWTVTVGAGEDYGSHVTVLGQRVSFGIREPRKQIPNEPAKPERLVTGEWYTPFRAKYSQVPSGRLCLVIRNRWGRAVEKSLSDGKTVRLEEKLNDFMVTVVALAHERSEWDQRRLEAEQQRREAEQRRLAEQRRMEVEKARLKALEDQAQRWHRSRILVEYVAAVRTHMAQEEEMGVEAGELEEWLAWAESHARALNPLSGDVQDLIGVPGARSR